MTDRHAGYIVVLEHDIRDEDSDAILNAIRMVKGVISVQPMLANPAEGMIAEIRVKQELRQRIMGLLQ